MGRQDTTRGQTYLEGAGGRKDESEDGSKQLGEQECHRPRQQSWGRGRDEGELEVLAGHQVVVAGGSWSMESDPRMGGQGLRRRRGTWRRLRRTWRPGPSPPPQAKSARCGLRTEVAMEHFPDGFFSSRRDLVEYSAKLMGLGLS